MTAPEPGRVVPWPSTQYVQVPGGVAAVPGHDDDGPTATERALVEQYAADRRRERRTEPGRRATDRLPAIEGIDPDRPLLAQLVDQAIGLAERRGQQQAEDARLADRHALLDVLGALDRLGLEGLNDDGQGGESYAGAVAYAPPTLFALRDAARRARRHLDRTGGSTP